MKKAIVIRSLASSLLLSLIPTQGLADDIVPTLNVPIVVEDMIIIVPAAQQTSFKELYLSAINRARSQSHDCGEYGVKPPAPPLVWSDTLYQAAKLHSSDMAYSNTFDHKGSGTQHDTVAQALHPGQGSTLVERAEYAGYTGWKSLGENIAAGFTDIDKMIDAWLDSPGHCANLMNPDFKEVGMAEVTNPESDYLYYWTQDFGSKE